MVWYEACPPSSAFALASVGLSSSSGHGLLLDPWMEEGFDYGYVLSHLLDLSLQGLSGSHSGFMSQGFPPVFSTGDPLSQSPLAQDPWFPSVTSLSCSLPDSLFLAPDSMGFQGLDHGFLSSCLYPDLEHALPLGSGPSQPKVGLIASCLDPSNLNGWDRFRGGGL